MALILGIVAIAGLCGYLLGSGSNKDDNAGNSTEVVNSVTSSIVMTNKSSCTLDTVSEQTINIECKQGSECAPLYKDCLSACQGKDGKAAPECLKVCTDS